MIDFEKLIKRLHWMTAEKEIEWEDEILEFSDVLAHLVYKTAVEIDSDDLIDVEIHEISYWKQPVEVKMKVGGLFDAPDECRLTILSLLDCIDSMGTDTFESDAMEMEGRINQWLGDFEKE